MDRITRIYIIVFIAFITIIMIPFLFMWSTLNKTSRGLQQNLEQSSLVDKENTNTLNSLINKDYRVYCDGVEVKFKGTENPGQFIVDNYSYIINDEDKLINITNKEKVKYTNTTTFTPIFIPIK